MMHKEEVTKDYLPNVKIKYNNFMIDRKKLFLSASNKWLNNI